MKGLLNKFKEMSMKGKIATIIGILFIIGIFGSSGEEESTTETSTVKQEETVNEEKIDKEEVRKNLSMLEALYVNHYNSLSKLEGSSKIELQKQLDSSITTLNNGWSMASDYRREYKSNTDAYKAFDKIQFAIYELKEAKEYAIKYLDTGNYDDYKEYQTKLQISMDSYIKYTAFKDEFDVNINVSINE